jgi:nucleolar protein 12
VEVAEDGEDQSDLENASLNAQQAHNPDVSPDDDEESDGEPHFPPAHESLQKDKKRSQTGAKSKFVPADETAEQRDKRTIFVGNLSIEVAQKRVRCSHYRNLFFPNTIHFSHFSNSSSDTS